MPLHRNAHLRAPCLSHIRAPHERRHVLQRVQRERRFNGRSHGTDDGAARPNRKRRTAKSPRQTSCSREDASSRVGSKAFEIPAFPLLRQPQSNHRPHRPRHRLPRALPPGRPPALRKRRRSRRRDHHRRGHSARSLMHDRSQRQHVRISLLLLLLLLLYLSPPVAATNDPNPSESKAAPTTP